MPDFSREQWINHALLLAQKALPQDVPVGCVIVDSHGDILAEGWNQREVGSDATAHAEIVALRLAGQALKNWRLEGCTAYVTLEPCPMCAAALLQARIGAVVYGAPDPLQGAMHSALNLQTLYGKNTAVTGGILEAECQAALQDFFITRRTPASASPDTVQ